jgi:hypothetical protein
MTHLEWQFGGWLRDWPLSAAMGLLAVLAAAGLAGIVWSYRRASAALAPRSRRWLAGLRATTLLLLLLCLANPARVEDAATPRKATRLLAVLVDRSASMSTPDHRGETRLAVALRRWSQAEPSAQRSFTAISYARFANELQPAKSLADAATAGTPGTETHLFAALRQAYTQNPAAIVCLTDGLDTSGDNPAAFAATASARGVPIYFVPGENRLQGGTALTLREVRMPSQVLRQTRFTATAVLESVAAQDRGLPVELWVNGKRWSATTLPVRTGRNEVSWPVTVASGEPGDLSLEFRAGDQTAAGVTRVVESQMVDVLYYQGALQWGCRFLRGALESDPSFRLTALMNPALHVHLTASPAGGQAPADLPEDAADLKRYQVVILAHVFASQLSVRQQQALVDYVRGGGSLLFISPDTTATEQFSGSALEQMLPVVFASPNDADEIARRQMELELSTHTTPEGNDLFEGGEQNITLKPFARPAGASPTAFDGLFAGSNGDPLPQYCANTRVRAVKAGAQILAVSARNPSEILLARQPFGRGFAAALTTDLLWRWKLSLPSGSHAVERFWQQLFLSLTAPPADGLRLCRLTASPAIGTPVALAISGASPGGLARLEAVSPRGDRQALSATEAAEADDSALQAAFTPNLTGRWEVHATDASGQTASVTFPVAAGSASAELSNLPADLDDMRSLAESTGGSLVDGPATFDHPVEGPAKPPERLPEPLWNSALVLTALLGFYATELILRRRWKLL